MIRHVQVMAMLAVTLAITETAMAQRSHWAVTQHGVPAGSQPELPAAGGAFNLRILSDSVPDFSTRENFAFSALASWKTQQDKAIAQFRWVHRCRRVGDFVPEDGRPVLDPVLFFNSYGVTYCSMISQMNCSLWEAQGLRNRLIDLPGHCVSEVFYDDAWHLFDNDFCNYFINEKGAVASAAELGASRVHGNIADLKPGEYYLFDHCPTASCPNGRIFMGPSSASLYDVAHDWYPSPEKVRPRLGFTGSVAGHRYVLGVRPGESYTRCWQPMGTGEKFARLFHNGKDPSEEGGQVLRNSRANGQWQWAPDFTNPGTFHERENVRVENGRVVVADPNKPAYVVFRVAAANVITSGTVRMDGPFQGEILVSTNQGYTWSAARPVPTTKPEAIYYLPSDVGGRLEYLVKCPVAKEWPLPRLSIETITQVNPRTLPALKLGANAIVAVSDGHYETTTLAPRLSAGQAKAECFKLAGFESATRVTLSQPALGSTTAASLTLRARTPALITGVRMSATVMQPEPDSVFTMDYSTDVGRTWTTLRKEEFAGWPADHHYEAKAAIKSDPKFVDYTTDLRLRFDNAGCGLNSVVAEVNYEPAGPFMPYDVTYCWSEYRKGEWVKRTHTARIASPYQRYTINVGGERPPRMEWVRVAAPDAGGINSQPGYGDGEDVGPKFARPGYRIERGTNLAKGCSYEVSRPAHAAFPDTKGTLLTDGYFPVSSFWALGGINLTGKKNEKRVGELAVWDAGADVTVTVDLGKKQSVGGARIAALQPNERIQYPRMMVVETSTDGKKFSEAGRAMWEECFFPPADALVWEGADSPIYEKLPAGGILDHVFAVPFSKAVDARYVRLRMSLPADPAAAIALWELEVYDTLKKVPFEEPIALPPEPKR